MDKLKVYSDRIIPKRPSILTRMAGWMLYVAGLMSGRLDWQNLGHYLTMRGSRRRIRIHPRLTIVRRADDSDGWAKFDYLCTEGKHKLKKAYDHSYNGLGKFRIKETPDSIHILDHYLFYPICGDVEKHGPGCGCTTREWGDSSIDLHVTVPAPFVHTHKTWRLEIRARDSEPRVMFRLTVFGSLSDRGMRLHTEFQWSDKVFCPLGKPFYSVAHLPNKAGRIRRR